MEPEVFGARLGRFRRLLEEQGLDGCLIAGPENRYYLSGYAAEDLLLTESSGYLFISGDARFLLTDFRYEEQARQEAAGYEVVIYRDRVELALADLLSGLPLDRIGFESQYLSQSTYQRLEKALLAAKPDVRIVGCEDLVETLRIVKEPREIEWIRASLSLTERVLNAVWQALEPGVTEKALAWKIERMIREGGAQAVSFPPIVAGGPNAALPHAVPGDRPIANGDPVILDLGSRLDLYCSDMTRTWFAGIPSPQLREIYRVVKDAQSAAQDTIRAGMRASDVDQAARSLIAEAGYGEYFGHGLGHGVGLAVHETPRLRRKSEEVLSENMIVTVEPGIYLPGVGGVRLENMVRVTENGCEVLNGLDLYL